MKKLIEEDVDTTCKEMKKDIEQAIKEIREYVEQAEVKNMYLGAGSQDTLDIIEKHLLKYLNE